MKLATVFFSKKKVIIHSSSKTDKGAWIITKPVFVVESIDAHKDIGQAVIDALEHSQLNVPHPTSWQGLFDPVLQAAKVKSMNAFMKQAKCIEVELSDASLDIFPNNNLGAEGGFERDAEGVIRGASKDPVDLGQLLAQLLQQ
jgi:hypothetical protein